MKKFLVFIILSLCIATAIIAQKSVKHVILFAHDKYEISNELSVELEQLAFDILKYNSAKVIISGHTDGDGSLAYNDKLSRKRAGAVCSYLVDNGVDPKIIHMEYHGENDPVASNNNENGKSLNRRVVVEYQYNVGIPEGFLIGFNEFRINPLQDTTLHLDSKGSMLHIPASCFVDQSNSIVQAEVIIKYRDYRNSAQMAFSGISMVYKNGSGEYNFNSGGMFEVRGYASGEAVEIAHGKSMLIDYALAAKNDDMGFFVLNEGTDNWDKLQDVPMVPLAGKAEIASFDRVFVVQKDEMIPQCFIKRFFWKRKVRKGEIFIGGMGEDNGDRATGTLLVGSRDPGHTYPDIVKGLNVESFGVYNCDQIYRLPNRVKILADYMDSDGNPIDDAYVLSMIDLRYNGAFSFDPKSFICDPKGKNVLALFTHSGELYLLDSEEFLNMDIKQDGNYTFTMKNMTEVIKDSKDLAEYLGTNIQSWN